jgi:hypothetical protein
VAQVLVVIGERLAIKRNALLAQAETMLLSLRALSQSVSVALGPVTRDTLFRDEQTAGFHKTDRTGWKTWGEKLKANPQTEVTPD